MLGTRCSWLPGDERGFRSRKHRIHSSGNYKRKPPVEEHQHLREYHAARSRKPVSLALVARIEIARAFILKAQSLNIRIIAFTVSERHAHALVEAPKSYSELKKVIGKCKQRASYEVRAFLPGTVWSQGLKSERIRNKGHLHNTYDYLREKQEAGTVVWSHRPDEDWIANPDVGVIVMGLRKRRIRVFAKTRSDAGV